VEVNVVTIPNDQMLTTLLAASKDSQEDIATPDPDQPPADPLLTAALGAVLRGWAVFPLRPGSKRPALHRVDRCPGTGPCVTGHAGWEQRATHDPQRVRTAWSAGRFNTGIAAGPSGLVVIDLDVPEHGEQPPHRGTGKASPTGWACSPCSQGSPTPATP
jgi:hypothetical protein